MINLIPQYLPWIKKKVRKIAPDFQVVSHFFRVSIGLPTIQPVRILMDVMPHRKSGYRRCTPGSFNTAWPKRRERRFGVRFSFNGG